jgi:uroporphyrinogen-III synthase
MRIHIAARHEARDRAKRVAARLRRAGHRVVSRWIDGRGRRVTIAENALYTLTDIAVADCVVFFSERAPQRRIRRGANERHVELGFALRAGKRLCVVGPCETAYCRLPVIERYDSVKELIYGLR